MIIDENLLYELTDDAGIKRAQKAENYVKNKRVNITKVIYDDERNFELKSKVRGSSDIYNVYIKVLDNEIEDVTCTCPDYESYFGTCKHILASLMEFANNPEYIKIFAGITENVNTVPKLSKKEQEQNYNFKQLINVFYDGQDEIKEKLTVHNNVKIVPKIIMDRFQSKLKLEFKIGQTQMYKLKNLPEFFDNMLYERNHRYGNKLEFIHTQDAFEESSRPILNYILKYSEIIKYANMAQNSYSSYGNTLSEGYITISNTGLDDLFEIIKGKTIELEDDMGTKSVLFVESTPNINFEIEEASKNNYRIIPNIDIYEYKIFEGKSNTYLLYNNILYKCDREFANSTLKLLNVFRKNFVTEIEFKKSELSSVFSMVVPKIKNNIKLDKIPKEEIDKYMPKELNTKVYLDYDENNYIIADIKFCYDDIEFNPLLEENLDVARDSLKENETLEIFRKTGFMLDTKNAKLILAREDDIYRFLTIEIEDYMKKFEVLATENFRQKEVKMPKISSLGVKQENNLLEIDFENIDFDLSELSQIMEKYKLKKKYHRLKNGSFIELDKENDTINFLESLSSGMDISYDKLEKGKINLPMYRGLYLEEVLKNAKFDSVSKNSNYRQFVNEIGKKEFDEEKILPSKLNANLRSYQRTGYNWLKGLEDYKLGGILADDMGLGKTLQMLAVIEKYKESFENNKKDCIEKVENNVKNSENIIMQQSNNEEQKTKQVIKPSIVVCPSSLTINWRNEAKKFTSNLKVNVIAGNSEERCKQIKDIINYDLVITSYDSLKRDIEKYSENNIEFKYIIADEAQYIKNNNTQNAKAIKEIKAETKYALTGTPIENSLSELWSIFDFIMPGYLFSYRKFKEIFEVPIMKGEDSKAMERLKMLISPFVLRRTKKEVLTELPDKTISVLNNEMQDEQLELYLSYLAQAKNEAMEEIKANGFAKSQIKILALLMRLRQICCHPSLFIENYNGRSSKLEQCIEIVKDAVSGGHKILLFSGYSSMFELIEDELKKENIKFFKLTGKTKIGDRIEMVDEFNKNDEIKVFLISLKAGGTGLNLTGADMVIHYDPWWNLSAENQATDRTYRIGQKKNVQVYKLITKNSIEEKIYELQERKAKLMDDMLSTKETFISKLSKDEIMDLFK